MLNITVCTVCLFEDAAASVKLDNKSLFNKKKNVAFIREINFNSLSKIFFQEYE